MNSSRSTKNYHLGDGKELPSINILFVGGSQSGKSTLIKILKDPSAKLSHSGFPEIKNPYFDTFTITDSNSPDATIYRLNIIDTPGLKEIRHQTMQTRTDDDFLSELDAFIKRHIDRLNCLCFVTQAIHLHQKDIEVFEKLMNFFGPALSKYSMMILTHADQYTDEKLQQFERDIKNHPLTSEIYKYCELGIYHHGIIDYDDLETYADNPDLQQCIVQVKQPRIRAMTEKLIKKFIECGERNVDIKFRNNQSVKEASSSRRPNNKHSECISRT
ncbi:unnamed protein product [Rotaria sp. Silwood2]|nr:unnamed protein product [Rotaria sp. Silwood2]CAF4615903.1 unnamed protein product [Rotaria sp. Silwood2]